MSVNWLKGATEWALMVGLVFGAGALVQAQEQQPQDEAVEEEAEVIQIGKPDQSEATPHEGEAAPVEMPKHWIGLLFGEIGPDSALRAQLDLPEGQGLLIEQIVPGSPAEKAGLKRHDILLRANDSDLKNKEALVDLVRTAGEKKGEIALDVLRHGKRETIKLTPEERPADAQIPGGLGGGFSGTHSGEGQFGLPPGVNLPEELLRQFGNAEGGGGGFQFRNFGPGVILGDGGPGVAEMPDGVSISVHKEQGKPTKVTVTRGDESWEVIDGDKGSLEKLPEDLRPIVENMMHGGSGLGLRGQRPVPEFGNGRLRERLERMEKQLEEMRERMQGRNDQPVTKPAGDVQE